MGGRLRSIAHFSCSKTEFGKKVINDINQHLLTTYTKDKFDEINGPWYSSTDRAEIQSYLQKHYLDHQIALNKSNLDNIEK